MKSFVCAVLIVFILSGCSTSSDMDVALDLRERVLTGTCSFTADITADYEEHLYNFQMDCSADKAGNLTFTVTEPVSIAGITGIITAKDAKLTFNDAILSFPPLAGGRLAPVTGPWIFMNTLRSGYLSACGREGDGFLILAEDSYEDNALRVEIMTDSDAVPLMAEIFWNQRRILSVQIEKFQIM